MINNNFKFDGDKLKQLRLDLNLKQCELADMVGVGKDRICRYEKGEEPRYEVLIELASVFNIKVRDLFYTTFTN